MLQFRAFVLSLLTLAGSALLPADAQTLAVLASATPINVPEGVLVDGAGNVYVANGSGPGNVSPTVVKMTPDGTVTTVFTEDPSQGYAQIFAIALDGNGNLFVADSSHDQIFRVTPAGAVSTFVTSDMGIGDPEGLAVDAAGNLYVSNLDANTISEVTPAGVVSLFVGAGAGLNGPQGMVFDQSGNLYVANSGEGVLSSGPGVNTISKVTPAGIVTTLVAASQGLSAPRWLAIDQSGNLFESDFSQTIHEIAPAGTISVFYQTSGFFRPRGLAIAGTGQIVIANELTNTVMKVAAGGAVTILLQGNLADPEFSAFDAAGNLYVTNDVINTISKITPAGIVSTFVDSTKGLSAPEGLAFDAAGNLYVANLYSGEISKVTPAGIVSTFVDATQGLADPNGLAIDGDGNLYVGSGGAVFKVSPAGGLSTFVPASAGLDADGGLALDSAGNLYVANGFSGTVSKVTPAGSVSTFVGAASGLFNPFGLAVDAGGNLYVTTDGDGSIFEVSPAGAVSVAVQYLPGAITPQPVALSGLTIDGSGRLFASDWGSNSIFEISFAASPLAAAVLPGSRSVEVGSAATVYATMINGGTVGLTACGVELSPLAPSSLSMSFQTSDPATNALTGEPNQTVPIAAGAYQTFVLAFQSTAALSVTALQPVFYCDNVEPAASTPGVSTIDLTFSTTPIADIIALAAVATGDGTVHIANGVGAFAVASVDVGAAASLTVAADTGSASLPLTISLCQTSATGQCLAPPAPSVPVSFATNATPTFSVFTNASGPIPFAPGASRIFVRFTDASSASHGSTSVAVTTD